MAESQNYFSPELIASLGGLRLRAAHVADGWVAGGYSTKRYGNSVDFADHKSYSPGDDSRYIDWKLHARSDRYTVRRFQDESNRHFQFLIDSSASMSFRGSDAVWSKWQCACTIAVALATICLKGGDAVGGCRYQEILQDWFDASRSNQAMIQLIQSLESRPTSGVARLSKVLDETAIRLSRRTCLVVLSDIIDPVVDLELPMARLIEAGHQILFVRIVDREEEQPKSSEVRLFVDLETKAEVVFDPLTDCKSYMDAFKSHANEFKTIVERFGGPQKNCKVLSVITQDPIAPQLFRILDQVARGV